MAKNHDSGTSGKADARLRAHLWFENDGGQLIGLGRVLLLEEIDRQGSLNKAAKAMGMSYRGAWGRLKKSEEMLGLALVEQGEGRSFQLTDAARELIAVFRAWYEEVEAFALKAAQGRFPWEVKAYDASLPDAPPED